MKEGVYLFYGIDVSKYQGDINWAEVKNAGKVFAIIRAGYGRFADQKDPYFDINYAGCTENDIAVGAYQYSYARTIAEAEQEAEVFLDWISGKRLAYPVYIDVENESLRDVGRELLTDAVLAWCNKISAAGYYTGIYSNPNFFTNYLDLDRLTAFDKWLANWAETPVWGNEFGGLWQYSSTGSVEGIESDVSLDYSYRDYPSIIRAQGLNGFPSVPRTLPITLTLDGVSYSGTVTQT